MDQSNPQDPAIDDAVANYLVAYQERAEAGEATAPGIADETEASAELRERMQRAARCIDLLLAVKQTAPAAAPHGAHGLARQDERSHHGANGLKHEEERAAAFADEDAANETGRPRRLGRFEIRSELGSGGFGIVYRAWDPRTAREVALKIPRIEFLASTEMQCRFEQEAEATARLDHPHIVSVLEAGVDGMLPYIASKFYPGVTLARWLRERTTPIAPRDAALLLAQLAEAVDHAHAQGVLHRDVKPSNVLLAHAEVESRPASEAARFELAEAVAKLMDFGLAKLADSARDMTRSGAMLGTVRYMAPEQAAGRTRDIGPASDVYSLGAVLYELLTGKPPFANDSDVEVLRRVMVDEPIRIRLRRPDAPRDLETICAKCLEKEPAKRYATAGALAADLRRFLAGEPIRARRASAAEIGWKWARRRPSIAALVVVCAASAVSAIIGIAIYNKNLRAAAAEARSHAARAEELAIEARSQADRAEQQLYAGDLRAAQLALERHRAPDARELLERHAPAPDRADRREFAYGHLLHALQCKYAELPTHPGPVYTLAYSPDGSQLATACADGHFRVFDMRDRSQNVDRHAHPGGVNEVAFSPDGSLLATGGEDGWLFLWSTDSWRIVRTLAEGPDSIVGLSFSSDGKQLLSATPLAVQSWDLESGQLVSSWSTPQNKISEISRSTDGSLLSVSAKGATFLLRADDLSADCVAEHLKSGADVSAFSSDGAYLIVGEGDGRVYRLDNRTERVDGFLPAAHTAAVKAVERSPDGRYFITASRDASVQVFEAETWTSVGLFRGHGDRVWDVDFSPDGENVVSCDSAGRVLIWSLPNRDATVNGEGRREFDWPFSPVSVDFSPRHDEIAFGMQNGAVQILDHETLKTLRTLAISDKPLRGLAYNRSGDRLFAAVENGDMIECDAATGAVLSNLSCGARIHDAQWAPDRKSVAISDAVQFEVSLWTWPELQCRDRYQTVPEPTSSLTFLPKANMLCISQPAATTMHRLDRFAEAISFGEKESWTRCCALTPDGKTGYFAEFSKQISVRDIASGKLLHRLAAHKGPVTIVAISPDGKTLASGSQDGVLILWDVASQRPALEFENCPISQISQLTFSPDNKWLILRAYFNNRVLFWRSDLTAVAQPTL